MADDEFDRDFRRRDDGAHGTHSFGIQWGALKWADWHDGHWWMTFANYDRLLGPDKTPYGHKANTVMVKFTKDLQPVQSWTLPKAILDSLRT